MKSDVFEMMVESGIIRGILHLRRSMSELEPLWPELESRVRARRYLDGIKIKLQARSRYEACVLGLQWASKSHEKASLD